MCEAQNLDKLGNLSGPVNTLPDEHKTWNLPN